MRIRRTALPVVTAAALVSCAAAPLADFAPERLDGLHLMAPMSIPARLAIDTGERPRRRIRVGDAAVYSLHIREPTGVRAWLVRVSVAAHLPRATATGRVTTANHPPIEFGLRGFAKLHLQVWGADGEVLGESVTEAVSTESLSTGFAAACEFFGAYRELTDDDAARLVRELPAARQRPILLSVLAANSVVELLLEAEPLTPLLAAAVRRPSLLTVVGNLSRGISISFDYDRARTWSGSTALPGTTAYVFPLDVKAYGERALAATVVAVGGDTPTPVCVGVASVAAVHPDRPDIQVQLRVQAVGRLRPAERARVARQAAAGS